MFLLYGHNRCLVSFSQVFYISAITVFSPYWFLYTLLYISAFIELFHCNNNNNNSNEL